MHKMTILDGRRSRFIHEMTISDGRRKCTMQRSEGNSMDLVTSNSTYKNMNSVPPRRPLLPSLSVRQSIIPERLRSIESSDDGASDPYVADQYLDRPIAIPELFRTPCPDIPVRLISL